MGQKWDTYTKLRAINHNPDGERSGDRDSRRLWSSTHSEQVLVPDAGNWSRTQPPPAMSCMFDSILHSPHEASEHPVSSTVTCKKLVLLKWIKFVDRTND